LPLVPIGVLSGSYLALGFHAASPELLGAVTVYCLLQNTQQVMAGVLRGQLRFRAAATTSVWGRLAAAAATAAFASAASNASLAVLILALAVGELVSTGAGFACAERKHSVPRGTGTLTIRAGLPFSVTALMVSAYNRLDTLAVAALGSASVLAAYAPASRLQDALWIVPITASTILLPILSTAGATHSVAQTKHIIVRATLVSAGVSLVAAACVTAFIGTAVDTFAPEFAGSTAPMSIIVWSLPIVAVNAAAMAALNALGYAWQVPYGVLAALLTSVVLLPVLVPLWGANGAALASALRELPAMVVLLLLLRKTGMTPAGSPPAPAPYGRDPGRVATAAAPGFGRRS
jgi:O-antigen/teichoic acid export membrane protein